MSDEIIRTRRLELLDRQDRVRAVLACDDDTAPSITILDTEGQARVILGIAWNEMPQIQLTAPDGTARVALVVRPEGIGMVIVADDDQQSRTLTPDEGPPR